MTLYSSLLTDSELFNIFYFVFCTLASHPQSSHQGQRSSVHTLAELPNLVPTDDCMNDEGDDCQ